MPGGFILLHIIPIDGKLFDDPEQAIFSLVLLNLAVFILLILALISVKEGRKKAALEAKARRKALKQSQSKPPVSVAENSTTPLPKTVSSSTSTGKANHNSQPLATVGSTNSKNYTRPSKK